MLHAPSYNCGLCAGLAWKYAGNDYIDPYAVDDGTPLSDFMMAILDKTEGLFFFPSSFREGFHNAWVAELKLLSLINDPPIKAS